MSGFLVFFRGGYGMETKNQNKNRPTAQHINWHDYYDNNRSTYFLIYKYEH